MNKCIHFLPIFVLLISGILKVFEVPLDLNVNEPLFLAEIIRIVEVWLNLLQVLYSFFNNSLMKEEFGLLKQFLFQFSFLDVIVGIHPFRSLFETWLSNINDLRAKEDVRFDFVLNGVLVQLIDIIIKPRINFFFKINKFKLLLT